MTRILAIHLAGLGDLVMGIPALSALRAAHPGARLELLTWDRHGGLAARIPGIDQVTTVAPGWPGAGSAAAALLRLRRERFALAVNLYRVHRSFGALKLRLLLAAVGAGRSAGRDTDGRGWCFDLRVPERSADPGHEVERQLALVRAVAGGTGAGSVTPALVPAAEDASAVARWLARGGAAPDEDLMVLHPGGARAGHRWPWERFVQTGRVLAERGGARLVVTGSDAERRLAERVAGAIPGARAAAGELSLAETAALLARARLVITNDSGPMHLAAAVGAPMVAVFGPGDPARFGPYPHERPDQVVLHAEGDSPCVQARCRGHRSLESLPAGAVLAAADAVLRGGARPGRVTIRRRRRRVLHVHTLPVISGSGLNTFLSMRGQQAAGFDAELACADGGPLLWLAERQGMTVRRLRHMVWPIHPIRDALALCELRRLMREGEYALVHTHNSKAGFLGRLAARLAGVPAVVHTIHGYAFHDQEPPWRRALFRTLERLAAGWCDRLVAISEPLVEWTVAARIAPRTKLVKIYSGIDLEAFRAPVDAAAVRRSLGLPPDAFVVGEVAKLWAGKGHDVLLRAAAALARAVPSLRVLLVGEGSLRAELERVAEELGIRDRVVFAGFREDIPALTRAMDVAVLPSLFEGMGRAVLEAQAAGRPVVASRVGGVPELIEDGRTGLLVPPGDAGALERALEALANDAGQRARLGATAQQSVDARFSAERMVSQLVDLYNDLMSPAAERGAA
ncbi:MAG TPA: glycosyltransferase [bacterium]